MPVPLTANTKVKQDAVLASVQATYVDPEPPKPVYIPQDPESLLHAATAARWGENQWPSMRSIATMESGLNPYARNTSSGACGIPQSLPCSKLLNVIGSLDNVKGQIDWMVGYIADRYTNPTNALIFHQRMGWY